MYCTNLTFKFYPQTQKKACGILWEARSTATLGSPHACLIYLAKATGSGSREVKLKLCVNILYPATAAQT
jgi:hypothetical protein